MFEALRKYLGESISRSLLMPLMLLGPVLILGAAWFSGTQQIRIMERDAEGNARAVMSAIVLGIESMNEKVEVQQFISGLAAELHMKSIVIVQAQDQLILASSSIQDIGKKLSELQDAAIKGALSAALLEQNHEWRGEFDGSDYRAVTAATHQIADSQRTVAPNMIAICFVLDFGEQSAKIRQQTIVFGVTLIVMWGLMLGVLTVQLDKMVLRPAARIQECLGQEISGAGRRVVDAGCGGELGMLATTLNESFEALEESENRFRTLFETMAIGVMVQDAQGHVVAINPAGQNLLRVTKAPFIGRVSTEAGPDWINEDGESFPPDQFPSFRARQTGKPVTDVTMGIAAPDSKDVRWLRVSAVPSFDRLEGSSESVRLGFGDPIAPNSKLSRIFVTFEDVTARRQALKEIYTLALQVKQAPYAILRTDMDRKITWGNDAFETLTGYSLEEVIGKKPGVLLQRKDTDPATVLELREALDLGQKVRVEILNYHKSGKPYWIELTVSPLNDEAGKQIGFVGYASDITARLTARRELQATRDQLSTMNAELERRVDARTLEVHRQAAALEASLDGIALYQDNRVIYANLSQIAMFGMGAQDAIGHSWQKQFSKESQFRMREAFDPEGRISWAGEVTALRADGSTFEAEVEIVTLPDQIRVMVTRDVSEKKRSARELAEAKRFLETVLDSFPIAVFWKDRDSRYLGCNREFALRAQKEPSEVVGCSDDGLAWKGSRAVEARNEDLQVIKAGRSLLGEVNRVVEDNGEECWFETNKVPLRDGSGSIIGVVGSFQDITRRVQSERALQERETRYRALMESSGDAIILADLKGQLLEANEAAQKLLGYRPDEFVQMSMEQLHPEDNLNEIKVAFHRISTGEISQVANLPMLRKNGEIVYADLTASLVELRDAAILQGNFRDVTARRESELRLREISDQLELSLQSGQIGCWSYDLVSGELSWDHRMFALYGLAADQFSGTYEAWRSALSAEDLVRADSLLQSCISEGKPFDTQFTIRLPDGRFRNIQAKGVMIPDETGATIRVVGINYDISAMIEREKTLAELNHQLERATRQKDEFLANMSHELRTPLNAILGMSEALQMGVYGALGEKQTQPIQRIEESGRHLLSLINDILDLAKIEAGKISLDTEPTGVEAICTSVLRLMDETARGKGVRLASEYDAEAPDLIVDPRRLRQILLNLLSNALKFTEKGGTVRLTTKLDNAAGMLVFSVHDTGAGIPEDKLHLLFQPFSQLESVLTKSHGGTGLGLSIVRKLAEMHGGSVAVQSVIGKGSTFSVHLPWTPTRRSAASVAKQATSSLQREPVSGLEPIILIVEDNDANVQLVCDFLQASGYRTNVARNGLEAVDMVASTEYALVLMDVQMPEMDGMEATRRIRKLPNRARLPIIALTSFAMPGDREMCLAAGMTDYMPKPISLRVLGLLMATLLKKPLHGGTN